MIRKGQEGQKPSVRLDMTGDEFKRLIEYKDPNDVVDTLQEIMHMFDGIGDGETIVDYIRRVAVTPDNMPYNSVGTEQIKENSVMMDDLNEEVRKKMTSNYYDDDESLYLEGETREE